MKTTQYVRQEQAIAAADSGGIRERWMWGLRLLRDPDAFSPGSTQLKPGHADELVQAIKVVGRKISQREIQYRLRAARTYRTDSQIAQISARFENWSSLIAADFPAIESLPNEAPADHRTEVERKRDRARVLASLAEFGNEQGALFPLSDFEPITATLKELEEYADQQEAITARFAAHGHKRRAYLENLKAAVDGDLSATWQHAHEQMLTSRGAIAP